MNYIEIEIGGKKRGLKFNELAVRKYSELILQDVANGLDNANDIATNGLYAMFYGALVGNCFVKREPIDFTFENVCDWVEVLSHDVIKQVSDLFIETNSFKELLEKVTAASAEIVKKKNPKQRKN